MSRIAYVNGRYVTQRHASVNIEDRGYQFADGVYEVVYLNAGRMVDEERHLSRLERSLRELRIAMPMARPALVHVLNEVVRRNRMRNGLIYMQVTRGVAPRDHVFPRGSVPPAMVVTIRRTPAYPEDVERWTARVITQPDQRWARCDIKSVALLPNVLARQAARERGAQDAVLVDKDGMVTEGAATSIWIVDANGVLRTRHLDHGILPGCTRDALLSLLDGSGIRFEQRAFSTDELLAAREAFLTSASSFVKPIVAVDDRPVGNGGVGLVTRQLFDLFAQHVRTAA